MEIKDAPKLATERLIESIISGVLKSASDVAEAAKEAVGADKVEEPVTR